MPYLSDYRLVIPSIWEQDWEEALNSSQGIEHELILAQAKGAHLLRAINESQSSSERLGWLCLWSKAFAALEVVASALSNDAKLALQLTARNVFELSLHVHVVVDPVLHLYSMTQSSAKVTISRRSKEWVHRQTIDRLRAYTAWCLWHDRAYYQEMLDPRTLTGIWNAEPAKSIKSDKKALEQYEHLFGKLAAEVDEKKLRAQRAAMQEMLAFKVKRIEEWLEDPQLRPWKSKLEEAAKETRGSIPFFYLFDKADKSVPSRLRKIGLRFGYYSHMLSSNVSHGSSMEYFVHIGDDTVIPDFIA